MEEKRGIHISQRQRRILLAVCCAAIAASLAYIVYYGYGLYQQKSLEVLQRELVSALPPLPAPAAGEASVNAAPPSDDGAGVETAHMLELAGQINDRQPEPDYKARFRSILDVNYEFYGLLTILELGTTIIDSFVVQGSDNDYYMSMTFDRRRNERGTLFLDFRALPWFNSKNYVIYGHNMRDGTMFRDLTKYESIDTYLRAPIVEFDTVYGPSTWLIFAAYVCEYDSSYYHTNFSDESFEEFLEDIQLRSYYHTGVDVSPTDTLLTLSTCSYDFQDARFVVHARLLREGENAEGFNPTAEVNRTKKSPNVPNQIRFQDMPADQAAFAQFTRMRRYYFFQPDANGIIWYMGTSASHVQGPYSAWTGAINSNRFSWLAAGVSIKDGHNTFYIVSGGLHGDAPGLSVLRRDYTPGGPFFISGGAPITPGGVDARWPVLYTDSEQSVTVFYTVNEGGVTSFYSLPISGGTPRLVHTADASLDARPSSVIDAEGELVLLVQEFATGSVRIVQLNSDAEATTVDLPPRVGRFVVYNDANFNRLRFFYEENGTITTGNFDIDLMTGKEKT